jgi:hydrogenase maturation protease
VPAAPDAPRVLVAALGHAWLRDQAFGLHVAAELRRRNVSSRGGGNGSVEVVDWSFGTIAAFQKLSDQRYDRAILVSGTSRGRRPGSLHRFVPAAVLPPPAEIQARIADCVMGLVSVDNLLILGRYFGALPDDVVLIEAEPADETWGDRLSPEVARVLDAGVAAVLKEIARPLALERGTGMLR